MRRLGLIPARKNSKGIPGKNIKPLVGKPLIAWTIEAALASPSIDRVVVSTDCETIARIAQEHGADVPFMRPSELARDHTSGIDPVLHACRQLPDFETVILLQPTSPLRTAQHIEAAIHQFQDAQADFLVSVSSVKHHPNWVYLKDSEERLIKLTAQPLQMQRQSLDPCYALNGAIYIANTSRLLAEKSFLTDDTLGYEMPPEDSIDIDVPIDLVICEAILTHRRANGS